MTSRSKLLLPLLTAIALPAVAAASVNAATVEPTSLEEAVDLDLLDDETPTPTHGEEAFDLDALDETAPSGGSVALLPWSGVTLEVERQPILAWFALAILLPPSLMLVRIKRKNRFSAVSAPRENLSRDSVNRIAS